MSNTENTKGISPALTESMISSLSKYIGIRVLSGTTSQHAKNNNYSETQFRDEYNADMLEENLLFGTPDQVINKLKRYENLGVNNFIYYASMGLGHKEQIKSLNLFCKEVMPEFKK